MVAFCYGLLVESGRTPKGCLPSEGHQIRRPPNQKAITEGHNRRPQQKATDTPLEADTHPPGNRHPPGSRHTSLRADTPLGADTPPRADNPPWSRHPPRIDTPQSRHPTQSRHPPLSRHPLVNRMTGRCKNIILPQTSFAGSKNLAYLQCRIWTPI